MAHTLVLVRHGQSEWNKKNLFTGWRDVELTEQGRTGCLAHTQLARVAITLARVAIMARVATLALSVEKAILEKAILLCRQAACLPQQLAERLLVRTRSCFSRGGLLAGASIPASWRTLTMASAHPNTDGWIY